MGIIVGVDAVPDKNDTPWSKGQAHSREYPLAQRKCLTAGLALVRHTCRALVPTALGSRESKGRWEGGQTKRVTRRADAKGGLSSPPNPPQVAAGASKPPLDAAMLVRPTQRSAQYMPPPVLLFLVGSFRPPARRVRLDKWEKTRRIKAAVPHHGREGGRAPRRCQTKKH